MSKFRPRGRPRRERLTAHAEGLHSYVGAVRGRVHPDPAMSVDDLLAETTDPNGGRVVLLRRVWEGKILRGHAELHAQLDDVLRTVTEPDHIASDPAAFDRTRYYSRDAGPSRWLLVVVSYEQQPARIISAFGTRKDPVSWSE